MEYSKFVLRIVFQNKKDKRSVFQNAGLSYGEISARHLNKVPTRAQVGFRGILEETATNHDLQITA